MRGLYHSDVVCSVADRTGEGFRDVARNNADDAGFLRRAGAAADDGVEVEDEGVEELVQNCVLDGDAVNT